MLKLGLIPEASCEIADKWKLVAQSLLQANISINEIRRAQQSH